MRTAIVIALLALSGCATIDKHTPPPAEWPRLEVREHTVSTGAMLGKCYATLSLPEKLIGSIPLACAWINLALKTCDIYITAWSPQAVIDHEREHCLGMDHVGSSTLADLLRSYRQAGGL